MKPQFLKVSKDLAHSFSARRDTMPDVNNRWHYHSEIELIYFKKGNGTQFVGDSISQFATDDIVLLGTNLPHYWKFDESYFLLQALHTVDVNVLHFNETFWGETFLQLPENKKIRTLLEDAKRGIIISGPCKTKIAGLIQQIIVSEGSRKLVLLMDILTTISEQAELSYIASLGFQHNFHESEKDRIHEIYNYSIANFNKKITLQEIATVANVSPNSFCKFFKSRSRKTYSQFINEVRVGHACKLLMDNELNVKEICYESGFYNFASFHKHFKKVTGKSPLTYQKNFVDNTKY